MTSYLLLTFLITVGAAKDLRLMEGNTVLLPSSNQSLININNTTSRSDEYERRLRDKLQNNQTSVITEDDETFQDQERLPYHPFCQKEVLQKHSIDCEEMFKSKMMNISRDDWCDLEHTSRAYYEMTVCIETLLDIVGCYYPNPTTQDFFIRIHNKYFSDCRKLELGLDDAPHWVVMILTLVPVSLIPVLVYVVIWKSKVQE